MLLLCISAMLRPTHKPVSSSKPPRNININCLIEAVIVLHFKSNKAGGVGGGDPFRTCDVIGGDKFCITLFNDPQVGPPGDLGEFR